jgi:hypothetical protein
VAAGSFVKTGCGDPVLLSRDAIKAFERASASFESV